MIQSSYYSSAILIVLVIVSILFSYEWIHCLYKNRSTRETTPCSLIRDPETIRTPGSTTKPASSSGINRRMDNSRQGHVPTTQEMDQFFQSAEEEQQRVFTDKYVKYFLLSFC